MPTCGRGVELPCAELEQREQVRRRPERIGERRATRKRQRSDNFAADLSDYLASLQEK